MANYSLVINSRFKPFSFERYIQPLQIYGQAYREMEDAYGALGIQAGTVESMLNKELDRDAYNQYQGYMQGLKENADILATQGLNPTLRNSLMNMRNRYSQEIVPIQAAAQRREKLMEEQRKLGPNYQFEFDASTTGLDKFMDNPVFNPRSVNLAEIRQRSASEFSQLAKQLTSFQEDRNMYRKGFDSTVLAKYGYSEEDAARVAESIRRGEISPEDAAAEAIYNSIYNSTNVENWTNNRDLGIQAVRNAIAEGVVGAIGEMTPQIVTDKKGLEDYRYQQEIDAYRRKKEIDSEFAQKDAQQQILNSFYQGSMSYLNADGNASRYMELINGLTKKDDLTGNVILDKDVFGNDYTVNPMEVYEALQSANFDEIYDKIQFTESQAMEYQNRIAPYYNQWGNATGPQKKALENSMKSIERQMKKDLLPSYIAQTYGANRVLTEDEYNMLKDLNYNPSSNEPRSVSDLYNAFNETSQIRRAYSLRMSGYDKPTEWASSYLNWLDNNDSFKGTVYKLNNDGTQGSPVTSLSDLHIKSTDDSGATTGRSITDIQYSPYTPNQIIIELGNRDRYLVPANIFGEEIGGMINDYGSTPIGRATSLGHIITSETDRAFQIHQNLVSMINGYNPVAPNTSATATEPK